MMIATFATALSMSYQIPVHVKTKTSCSNLYLDFSPTLTKILHFIIGIMHVK